MTYEEPNPCKCKLVKGFNQQLLIDYVVGGRH